MQLRFFKNCAIFTNRKKIIGLGNFNPTWFPSLFLISSQITRETAKWGKLRNTALIRKHNIMIRLHCRFLWKSGSLDHRIWSHSGQEKG